MTTRTLYIDIDDVGWDLLNNTDRHTPNIDKFRQESDEYVNYYGGPWCSRDRAARMTRLHAIRPQNLVGSVVTPNSTYSLPTDDGQLLPQLYPGVRTHRGKWHLCGEGDLDHRYRAGYDYFSGPQAGSINSFYQWHGVCDGQPFSSTLFHTEYVANDIMEDLALRRDLIHASFCAVHQPWEVPPQHLSSSYGSPWTHLKMALANLEALDTCLGRILKEAQRLDYNIVLVSDNSTDASIGGHKGKVTQEGLIVPLFIWKPSDRFGSIVDTATQATDIGDIILRNAGVSGYEHRDSAQFREYALIDSWLGHGAKPEPDAVTTVVTNGIWKLIRRNGLFELYRLPDESANLYGEDMTGVQRVAFNRMEAQLP